MTAEITNKRHIATSLLLVLALALLGVQAGFSKAQPRGDGEGCTQAHEQMLVLRGAETKPSARKVQQPFVPHLVCPAAQVFVREFRRYSLWTLQARETVGKILQSGDFRGRAPPEIQA